MRRRVLWCLFLLFCLGCERRAAPAQPTTQPTAAAETTSATTTVAEKLGEEPLAPSPLEIPIVKAPSGEPPSGGFPMVILMHGYNSNHRDFIQVAELAASKGLYAVSVPAPLEGTRPGGYQWKRGDVDLTHRYIQAIREDIANATDASSGRIWLVGFSQGGLHGATLVARYPDDYRGVLAISPAGWSDVPAEVVASERSRKVYVVAGDREPERYAKKTAEVEALMKKAGLLEQSRRHPGAHHFPRDWRVQFAEVFMQWSTPDE